MVSPPITTTLAALGKLWATLVFVFVLVHYCNIGERLNNLVPGCGRSWLALGFVEANRLRSVM